MAKLDIEIADHGTLDADTTDPCWFLSLVADGEVRRWLRRLPLTRSASEPYSMKDLTYDILLQPYLRRAWSEVDGSPGVAGRCAMMAKAFEIAQQRLERETGRTREHPLQINFLEYLRLYTDPEEGLP